MKCFVLGKIELCLCTLGIITILSLSMMGVRQTVRQVSSASKALPIYSVELPKGEKKVAYGINCAWGNQDIAQILDDLDRLHVKVTFFVVGDWCKKYPDTVKEMADRGHEIANHSDTHPNMSKLSEQNIIKEIENCSQKILEITGQKADLFRAPSGSYNKKVIQTVQSKGYYPIQWDCDSLDWRGYTPAQMNQRIQKTLKSGSILLFHNDTDYTAAALPELITQMQNDGYEIVPVGQLIHRGSYRVDHTGRQFLNQD